LCWADCAAIVAPSVAVAGRGAGGKPGDLLRTVAGPRSGLRWWVFFASMGTSE